MIIARIISLISNPVLILIFLPFFLVYKTTKDLNAAWNWTLYTLVFITIFVLFVLIGVKKKIFSDIDVSKREQRPALYFMGALLSVLYLYVLFLFQAPRILFITLFGIILGILITGLINIKIKASVHVAAISGLITSLSIIYKGYFLFLLILIFIIGWSRVKIKRHTVPEVIIGGILGSLLSLIMYFITIAVYS